MASETTSIAMPENFSMNETANGSPSSTNFNKLYLSTSEATSIGKMEHFSGNETGESSLQTTNFNEMDHILNGNNNLDPTNIIVAEPISYILPDYMSFDTSQSSLKVIDVELKTYMISRATPDASQLPQGRKKRELIESVIVGSYDFNFELKDDQQCTIIKLIDEFDQHMAIQENPHGGYLSLSQRLKGWTVEARQRKKSSKIDKIYRHKSLSQGLRSFAEAKKYAEWATLPSNRKRLTHAESQRIMDEEREAKEMIQEYLDNEN